MSMRAWQVTEHGSPDDVLHLTEVPLPEPGPGQLRVRVLASAMNFADTLLCSGEYQVRPELPFTPGLEVCGVVTAVGPTKGDPSPFVVGDRVLGSTVLPHGGYADEALMDLAETFAAPAGLDDVHAAALYIGYQTGWFALHRRAALRPGETLLVHAASGGVGSAAVQLGTAAGARVVGVVGGADKVGLARDLGCDVVVDRRVEDVVEVVNQVTGGRGADVVYDPVGGPAYEQSIRCIAFEGRILVVGFASGTRQQARLNHALVKNYSILGVHWSLYLRHEPQLVRTCHEELTRLADAGAVSPVVSAEVPLSEVPAALGRLAGGGTVGRMVVVP